MAEIVWSEPALADLDAIADYIALENPVAASELVKRIFGHIEQLVNHPESGSRPQELGKSRYRQIVEPPCRVFYRYDGHKVFILHVMRSEDRFAASAWRRRLCHRRGRKSVRLNSGVRCAWRDHEQLRQANANRSLLNCLQLL